MPQHLQRPSRKQLRPQQRPLQQRNWYSYESLVVARATSIGGFITGIVGCLDWSPLLGLSGFDQKQLMFTGSIILLIGVSTEVARRMSNGLSQP